MTAITFEKCYNTKVLKKNTIIDHHILVIMSKFKWSYADLVQPLKHCASVCIR